MRYHEGIQKKSDNVLYSTVIGIDNNKKYMVSDIYLTFLFPEW